jgi:hypothetical protein
MHLGDVMTENDSLLVQALEYLKLATTINNPAATSTLVDIAHDLQGRARLGFLDEVRSQKDGCPQATSTIRAPVRGFVR